MTYRVWAFRLILTLFVLIGAAFPQNSPLCAATGHCQFLDANGHPLAGGRVFSYFAGTTNPQSTFNNQVGSSTNSNPVILDAGGFADIWITSSGAYKIVVQSAFGVQQWTADNFTGNLTSLDVIKSNPTANQSINAFNLSPAIGNTTQSLGSLLAPWELFVGQLDNIQFVDGVLNTTVQAAINNLPSAGGTVYATYPGIGMNMGVLDPGTKAVTLYLGPYNYTVSQITLRKSFKIIGAGSSDNGTILQAALGNNPLFVLPQTNDTPATNVYLEGFRVYGSPGNTSQKGFFLDSSNWSNSGLWFSIFDDIYMQGFCGNSMELLSSTVNHPSANQFDTFRNLSIYRGGAPSGCSAGTELGGLLIEGSAGEMNLNNLLIQGQLLGNGTDLYVGAATGGPTFPNGVYFNGGIVLNAAAIGANINGAQNVSFLGFHEEGDKIGFAITQVSPAVNNWNIQIQDGYFACNTGVDSGNGADVSVSTGLPSNYVQVTGNTICQGSGNPDKFISSAGGNNILSKDNNFTNVTGSIVASTAGLTFVVAPAATINVSASHLVSLTASGTPIATINSQFTSGETITFIAAGSVQFATSGGNINLGGATHLYLNTGESATFVSNDNAGYVWQLVSTSQNFVDGGMRKAKRFASTLGGTCPTGSSIGNACTSATKTWNTAFPDSNYTVTCNLQSVVNQPHIVSTDIVDGTGFTVTIATDLASAANASLYCIADHD